MYLRRWKGIKRGNVRGRLFYFLIGSLLHRSKQKCVVIYFFSSFFLLLLLFFLVFHLSKCGHGFWALLLTLLIYLHGKPMAKYHVHPPQLSLHIHTQTLFSFRLVEILNRPGVTQSRCWSSYHSIQVSVFYPSFLICLKPCCCYCWKSDLLINSLFTKAPVTHSYSHFRCCQPLFAILIHGPFFLFKKLN